MAHVPVAIAGCGIVMVAGAAAQPYLTMREKLRKSEEQRQKAIRAAQRSDQQRQEANRALKKTTKEKRDILKAQKSEQEIEYKEAHQRVLEISVLLQSEQEAIEKFKMEREDNTAKVIVTLGMTGCGKSTLCNRLMGDASRKGDGSTLSADDRCTTSGRSGSCTILPKKVAVEIGDSNITVIDTPGFNDSSGKDREHMNDLCKYMKGCGGINAFVLVRNGTNVRFDVAFQCMLRKYHDIFGDEFFARLIIVATRIEYIAREQYIEDEREHELRDDICQTFLKEGQKIDIPVIPIGFDEYKEALQELADNVPSEKQQFDDIKSPFDDLLKEFEKAVEDEWNIEQKIKKLTAEIEEIRIESQSHIGSKGRQTKKEMSRKKEEKKMKKKKTRKQRGVSDLNIRATAKNHHGKNHDETIVYYSGNSTDQRPGKNKIV